MKRTNVDLKGTRILAVDDVPENLDVLLHTLESMGYEVLVANDGETALEVASAARPELVLLDVMMPGIDGYETCRRLKADPELAEVPVIFLTARDDIEGVTEGFTAGGVDYIVKPFRKEEVLLRIRTHLEREHYARELALLNAHLEEKVAERTAQLRQRLRQLEGRDRIARHMLTLHPLDEALDLVLEVVCEIAELHRATIFLPVEGGLQVAAARAAEAPAQQVAEKSDAPVELKAARRSTFASARQSQLAQCAQDGDISFAVVPILRDKTLLGLIEVERAPAAASLSTADLEVLQSFALEAAGAINDAQIRRDPNTWQDQLDDILELDEEIDGQDYFDQLGSAPQK